MKKRVQFIVIAALTLSVAAQAQSQSKKANKQQLDSIITLEYVQGKAGFKEKTTYRYTHFEELREEKVFHRTADNSGWRPIMKKEYNYDSQDQLDFIFISFWDSTSATWLNGQKMTYVVNASGKPTQVNFQLWNKNTSTWDLSVQENYSYTSNNDLEKFERGQWVSGTWIPEEKTEYFYHSDNRPDFNSTSIYNGSTWDSLSKVVHTYSGNKEPGLLLYWKWVSGNFLQIAHSALVPDFNGNNSELYYVSYQDGNTTDYASRFKYTYDLTFDYADLVGLKNNEIVPFINKLTAAKQERQEKGVGNFDPQFDYLYYYSSYNPSALHQPKAEMLEFYPNPATNTIQLGQESQQFESYSIYDLQGRLILEGDLDFQNSQIDISELSVGIYTIQARANSAIYTNKLIKN